MTIKIKKTISKFLLSEEGKVSKHSLIKLGVIISSFTLTSTLLPSVEACHCSGGNQIGDVATCGDLREGYQWLARPEDLHANYHGSDDDSGPLATHASAKCSKNSGFIPYNLTQHKNSINLISLETSSISAEHSHELADCLNAGIDHANQNSHLSDGSWGGHCSCSCDYEDLGGRHGSES